MERGPQRFVQLAMPGEGLLFAEATRRLGRSADMLVEGHVRQPAEPVFHARALVAGLTAEEAAGLAERLRVRYQTAVAHDAVRLECDVRPADLPPGMFGLLLAFQASFGPVWMGFRQGRLTLRAQAVGCTEGECAARLRQALRMAGVRRHVRVVDLAGPGLRPWDELMAWRARDEAPPAPNALARHRQD